MDNNKDNKKIIVICLLLVLIIGGISYFINNKERFIGDSTVYSEERIEKYAANQFIPVYISESDMANKYLNDFKYLMMNDLNSAYNVLNNDYKNSKYGSYENFVNDITNKYSVQFYKMSVDKFAIVNEYGDKFYYIYDVSGNLYIFKEISIMNYEVYLDDYTVEVK